METSIRNSTVFPFEVAFRIVAHRTDLWLQKHLDCTRRELWVMLCVNESKLRQKQIGEILRIHPNVLVKILDNMEKKDLLHRTKKPADRREHLIENSEKGKANLKFGTDILNSLSRLERGYAVSEYIRIFAHDASLRRQSFPFLGDKLRIHRPFACVYEG